jgi:hypothetical protein
MSNASEQPALEKRVQLVEGATQTMLRTQDRILEELVTFRQQFTNMQDEMHLIVAMYRTQQEALARIEAKLSGGKENDDDR